MRDQSFLPWHWKPCSRPCFKRGMIKESACNAGDPSSIPGLGRSPDKKMATHFSILAWRIPWTEEPDGLQSMGVTESDMTQLPAFSLFTSFSPHKQSLPPDHPLFLCRKLHLFTHSKTLPIRNHRMAPVAQRGPERSPHPLLPSTSQTGSSFAEP